MLMINDLNIVIINFNNVYFKFVFYDGIVSQKNVEK